MSRAARSGLTLLVLLGLLAFALAWGYKALTEPFPTSAETPVCDDVQISEGDKISNTDVVVSVLNASDENGLAGQVMEQLVALGFAQGEIANSDASVIDTQIWNVNPATKLVKSNLDNATVRATDNDYPGIVVVIGDKFSGVHKGKKSIKAKTSGTICSPVT